MSRVDIEAKRKYDREYYIRNRETLNQKNRARYWKNRAKNNDYDRERYRANRIQRCETEKQRWKRRQEGRFNVKYPVEVDCARCGKHLIGGQIQLDHNPRTMRFRGWLCLSCNTYFGKFELSLSRLSEDLEYLRRGENGE